MARKKQLALSDQLTVEIKVSNQDEYVQSSWSGADHFICKLCAGKFDTFNKQAMLEHLVNEHDSEKALNEMYGATPPNPHPALPQMGEHNLGEENTEKEA